MRAFNDSALLSGVLMDCADLHRFNVHECLPSIQSSGGCASTANEVADCFDLRIQIHGFFMRSIRRWLLLPFMGSLAVFAPSSAVAGCGEYKGQMQICFKDKCEVQQLIRHCSSAVAGSQWISDQGYWLGYSNPIGGRWTTFEVKRNNHTLYSGDPDISPWSFDTCGESRHIGGPCSGKTWSK